MNTRRARRAPTTLLILAVVLTALVSFVLLPPSRAAAEDVVSPAGETGFNQISQCLQSRNDFNVLLVVDESASLQQSDPDDRRARLLANLVRALGRQAGSPTPDGTRQIDLAVSTFARSYTPFVPWTVLDPAAAERIAVDLETNLPTRDAGDGTNHPVALQGARNQMAEAGATSELPPCQVVIFFTDGVLDVGDEAEDAAAAADMCAVDGVVDGLRRDGINVVSVMLFDPTTSETYADQYNAGRDLLKATAEGSGGSISCGTVPLPADSAQGAYLEGGVDRLAALFATAFALSNGATEIPGQGSPFSLTVDPGITSFTIIGLAPAGIELTSPNGQRIAISKDAPGDAAATAVWDFGNVTVTVPIDDAGVGEWVITRPGQSDDLTVFLDTGLGIKLDEAVLVAGERSPISGSIVRPGSDDPVDLSVYGSFAMSGSAAGSLTDPISVQPNGSFEGFVTPQGNGTLAQFAVTLDLTTDSGQQLAPVSARFQVPVSLPSAFPRIQPAALQLSPLDGSQGIATGAITVTGSAEGPTRVCVDQVQWSQAEAAARYTSNLAPGCFDLGANEQRTIDVAVTTNTAAEGRVTGVVPLTLTSTQNATRDVGVPTEFTATRPLNQAVRLGALGLLVLLGLLIPLVVLFLVNRWLARFADSQGVRQASTGAVISTAGVRAPNMVSVSVGRFAAENDTVAQHASSGPTEFNISPEALRVMPPSTKASREIVGPDGCVLRTHVSRALFGAPTATVDAPAGMRVFSSTPPHMHSSGQDAPFGLGMGDAWYVTIADIDLLNGDLDQGVPCTVSVFIAPVAAGGDLSKVAADLRQFRTTSVLEALRAHVRKDAHNAQQSDPGQDSSTPGGIGQSSGPGVDERRRSGPPPRPGSSAPPPRLGSSAPPPRPGSATPPRPGSATPPPGSGNGGTTPPPGEFTPPTGSSGPPPRPR